MKSAHGHAKRALRRLLLLLLLVRLRVPVVRPSRSNSITAPHEPECIPAFTSSPREPWRTDDVPLIARQLAQRARRERECEGRSRARKEGGALTPASQPRSPSPCTSTEKIPPLCPISTPRDHSDVASSPPPVGAPRNPLLGDDSDHFVLSSHCPGRRTASYHQLHLQPPLSAREIAQWARRSENDSSARETLLFFMDVSSHFMGLAMRLVSYGRCYCCLHGASRIMETLEK